MRFFLINLLLVVLCFNANGQILEPVKWDFSEKDLGNGEIELTFHATIDDAWSVYSQHTGEDGPVPTSINYDNEDIIEKVGDSVEKGHKKEGFDKLFDTNVIKFLGDKDFTITQKVKKKGDGPLEGYLTFMTCNNETCLPPTDIDFSFPLATATTTTKVDVKEKASKPVEKKVVTTTSVQEPAKININPIPAEKEVKVNVSEEAPSISLDLAEDTEEEIDQEDDGMLTPVTWSFSHENLSEDTYKVIYTADIKDGWNVYSQFLEEGGPYPTSITYDEGITLLDVNKETGHRKEGPDKLFDGMNVIKFLSDEPFAIEHHVKVENGADISGYLTYMTCNNESCLPPTDVDFSLGKGGSSTTAADGLSAKLVGDKVDQKRTELVSTYVEPKGNCASGTDSDVDKSLLWLFIAGILGGFAALMTPCVFPMIPITVSFFTKDTKRKGWVNGLIYAASIVIIYVLLGLLITMFLGPEALNALSTSWIANTIFFVIFIVFAFSFFGFYEITLPSSWTTKTDSMADKGGLLGIFFMATTLALVSFSCTGPIVGSALVAAANGGLVGPLIVMLGFSLALSLPFGLFAAFPAWLNSLPKSGGWMNSVKVVLGFLEVGFAFKFLSTADLTQHWGFLRYELFMLILILVAIAIALYLFGFIKFPHDSPIKKLSLTRKSIATAFALLAIYLSFGFTVNKSTGIYNSLWLTSGFSPPVNYNYFLTGAKVNDNIKKRFPSYTKCANNINCFKDYFEGMSYAKEVNKPAFLDFTGHGCQNCRRTEDNIWVDDKVRSTLNDDVVLISLYVDDREKLDEEFVSLADGKKKRTVGAKWADFQVVNFKQNSQPLYIMVTPEEEVITEPRGYVEGVEGYMDYLSCGLDWFRSR